MSRPSAPTVRVLADGLAFPEGPTVETDGTITLSEMASGRLTQIALDGSLTLLADVGGGPNGTARLGDGRLVVCQNGGSAWGKGLWPRPDPEAVEIFRPIGPAERRVTPSVLSIDADGTATTLATHFRNAAGESLTLCRPSDVCADDHGGFYLTDGGAAHGRTRDMTGVLYGTADGALREVIFPLEMPNGIAMSPPGKHLYVAETRTRRIWAFDVRGPGEIGSGRGLFTVPSGGPLNHGGVDGLCVDRSGRIIVATLGTGGVTIYSPDGDLLGAIPLDDVMTTNAALSPDEETLYVTLASSGRVVAIDDWKGLLASE